MKKDQLVREDQLESSAMTSAISSCQEAQELVSAKMTSSYMLEEAMSSRDDVSNQKMTSSARTGFSNDDISSDVITISS
ncbi:protein YELLOW SEEDLINGS 1 [Dorcoceras hygrometricum]|uniref:Protein YELLOW SEEDLINGS 1 n=1 Tax=Dorcoceras hygrometricum TaxID=472368 RepID=A0A2Z7AID4_9LAMI|nr:protein YELLOW SEEDLINGS 1 [Dorcoceras hygrometricum]